MAKLSKKMTAAQAKVDQEKLYTLEQATALVGQTSISKFDGSIDLHVRLGVDPRKQDQNIRSTTSLPHGTGKSKSVLVFCTPDKVDAALAAGADFAGLDEYVTKMQGGWTDIDVVIAMPTVMAKVGRLGRILGPRGLMPNPKSGTVTMDVVSAVQEVKKGKISFRADKFGIVHAPVGRASFSAEKLHENAYELLRTLLKLKPASAKGTYMKSITIAPTMGVGIKIDPKSVK